MDCDGRKWHGLGGCRRKSELSLPDSPKGGRRHGESALPGGASSRAGTQRLPGWARSSHRMVCTLTARPWCRTATRSLSVLLVSY